MKKHIVIALTLTTAAFAQGPLNPPGAPAPTMKTLLELWTRFTTVETQAAGIQATVSALRNDPRTVLTTSPVTILQPGSYVLGANITVPSLTAILIAADDVTLDLNGFTVSSTAAAPSGHGILISGARRNIQIKNGTIKGATTLIAGNFSGGGFTNGITCDTATCRNIVVTDIRVSAVAGRGIDLGAVATPGLVVERSSVAVCIGNGITAHSVRACDVSDCQDTGITARVVADSSAASIGAVTSDAGIVASEIMNSRATAIAGRGIVGESVHNCTATSTGGHAIDARNVSNSTGTSTSARGITSLGNVTNSVAFTISGDWALWSDGTISFCRIGNGGGGHARIAIGCTGNAYDAAEKHLGTQ